eukprot:CAMPEP_0170347984 /NCGR_PEP_ID=MMETSP0116_2-20130129/75258_1 /TAXON_ID=400756 /ORGANISM="Durinskia baltica, Strain CSIRO CS-38" /LENGTH=203 /DNA_ID=CAMNT_0010601819 /DNA_START=59 /DNA_END=670 /DNA_ORIENTATION=+
MTLSAKHVCAIVATAFCSLAFTIGSIASIVVMLAFDEHALIVNWVAVEFKNATVTIDKDFCVVHLYVEDKGNCREAQAALNVIPPNRSHLLELTDACNGTTIEANERSLMSEHNPPLLKLGYFLSLGHNGAQRHGDYIVTNPTPTWARVLCGEDLDEEVRRITMYVTLAIVFALFSLRRALELDAVRRPAPSGEPNIVGPQWG